MPVSNPRFSEIYRGQDEVGLEVFFVGSGDSGNGLTGPARRDRVLRGVTNRVFDADSDVLYFLFDAPDSAQATELDGISGPGDSRSGQLIMRDGQLFVIGVSCCQDFVDTEGLYGVTEIYPRVSRYADWIDDVISGGGENAADDASM